MTDELADTLREIVVRLEAQGIAYMVVDRAFSETEFARRARMEVMGVSTFVASVEDIIVAKLEWAKAGGSERQLEDVRTLVRLRGDQLDRAYVEQWVQRLNLREMWDRALGA